MSDVVLQAGLFCQALTTDTEGRKCIIGVHDTVDVVAEGDGELPSVEHPLTAFLQVTTPGLRGSHALRLRYVDPTGRPVPGEAVAHGEFDGTVDGWQFAQDTRLTLAPPRPGIFRLLVEFDGQPIGSIPIKVRVRRTSHRFQ